MDQLWVWVSSSSSWVSPLVHLWERQREHPYSISMTKSEFGDDIVLVRPLALQQNGCEYNSTKYMDQWVLPFSSSSSSLWVLPLVIHLAG